MWAGLVSADLPVNSEEIARLNEILKIYEAENLRLVRDNQTKDAIIEANHNKQLQLEKERQGSIKKLKAMEGTLKFERIAAEGLTKKAGVLEIECTLLKEDKEALEDKLLRFQRRVEQLESTFNKDRSKLLQNIHEIELLSVQCKAYEERTLTAEENLRKAQVDTLSKIQVAESLIARTDRQQRTVHEQADEMLALTREVYDLRMRNNELAGKVAEQEKYLSQYEMQVEQLNRETHRLRRELLDIAQTHSQKSLAFFTGLSQHRVQTRILESSSGDRRVQYTSIKDLSASLSSGFESLETRQMESTIPPLSRVGSAELPYRQPLAPSSVISAASTAHRPQSNSIATYSAANLPALSPQSQAISGSSRFRSSKKSSKLSRKESQTSESSPLANCESNLGSILSPGSSAPVSSLKMVHDELAGMTSKSMFVGSGLGLRQERTPQLSSSKGTAKQVLKEIMTKFDN